MCPVKTHTTYVILRGLDMDVSLLGVHGLVIQHSTAVSS